MKPRFAADYRTLLWALVFFPGVALSQYAFPQLVGWLIPLSLYMGFCAGVFSHNHNHCPTFKSRRLTPSTRRGSASSTASRRSRGSRRTTSITTSTSTRPATRPSPGATRRRTPGSSRARTTSSPPTGRAAVIDEYIRKAQGEEPPALPADHRPVRDARRWPQAALLALGIARAPRPRLVARHRLWFFGFACPAFFANWSMIFINYIQHVHCRPVVGAQPLAELRLQARQLARLQQRLPRRAPRERRPSLEQAPRGAREDRAPDRPRA